MKKIVFLLFVFLLLGGIALFFLFSQKEEEIFTIQGTISSIEDSIFFLKTKTDSYPFLKPENTDLQVEDEIKIEYQGTLDIKNPNEVVSLTVIKKANPLFLALGTDGIFKNSYEKAYQMLQTLSLEEKIGQLLLARVPETQKIEAIQTYHLGGYVLFANDFKGKTKEEVITMTNSFQEASKIPLLLATDEEGGTVVRVSSNKNLRSSPFSSPQKLYQEGGFEKIKEDTKEKSQLLASLGINVNLAPVADVSLNPTDYMYKRSFGGDTKQTQTYIETVITESKNYPVSYTLKHFPGYGNNQDTHTGSSVDSRTYEQIKENDLPPFETGISSGAEAILVSHNIVSSMDAENPASLSSKIHDFLRQEMKFTGIVMTDDLDMGAVNNSNYQKIYEKAFLAGNDLLIVTDYQKAYEELLNAVNQGTITEDQINLAVLRILSWKYEKNLWT